MIVSNWLKTLSGTCLECFNAVHDELPKFLQGNSDDLIGYDDDGGYLLEDSRRKLESPSKEIGTRSFLETNAWKNLHQNSHSGGPG